MSKRIVALVCIKVSAVLIIIATVAHLVAPHTMTGHGLFAVIAPATLSIITGWNYRRHGI